MNEEEVKSVIPPEQTAMGAESPPGETEQAGNQNQKAIDYINRFVQGSPTGTPEEIIAGLVAALDVTSVPYDKLYDIAETSPEDAAFIYDYMETGNAIKSFVRNYEAEEVQAAMEAMQEDDDYEEDRRMKTEKVGKAKEYQSMMATNMTNSQMGAQEFVDRRGLTEAQIDEFKPFVDKFLKDCEDRNLTADNWETIYNGFKRNSDVAEAEETGRVMGRNEQIVAKRATRDDIRGALPEANAGIEKAPARTKTFAEEFMSDI
jgi:hypothetical protein